MTKDDIITLPNKHLRTKSEQVKDLNEQVLQVVEDMKAATLSWDKSREHEIGVALAAIQIDRPYKIVIIRNDLRNKEDLSFNVYINPEIVKLYGSILEDYEGCLSVPEIYGKVPRYDKVKIKARNLEGQDISLTASGFLARTFQHEIDHTEGTLFIDKIKDSEEAFYVLNDDGKLEKLDYEKDVQSSNILWK